MGGDRVEMPAADQKPSASASWIFGSVQRCSISVRWASGRSGLHPNVLQNLSRRCWVIGASYIGASVLSFIIVAVARAAARAAQGLGLFCAQPLGGLQTPRQLAAGLGVVSGVDRRE